MDTEYLRAAVADFLSTAVENRVAAEDALRDDLAGMTIYDSPLLAVGVADDPLFVQMQTPGIVGPGFMLPTDWLPRAQSVISVFLPFAEQVRRSNRPEFAEASDEWLHARIEGQLTVNAVNAYLCGLLRNAGYAAVIPAADSRFKMIAPYCSNWSERHVAYVCGLGTFGLSRGLITERGMAGRLGSIVTDAPLDATVRPYSDPFEYCISCGKCAKNCPVQAIDLDRGLIEGKDQDICRQLIGASYRPPHGAHQRKHYGCGKCQVSVPCENRNPRASK